MGWQSIDMLFAGVEERQGEVCTGTAIGTNYDSERTPEYGFGRCLECGADITHRGNAAKRCEPCSADREAMRLKHRERRCG